VSKHIITGGSHASLWWKLQQLCIFKIPVAWLFAKRWKTDLPSGWRHFMGTLFKC